MTTKERALGRLFDISQVIGIADLVGGAKTGNRVHLKNARGVAFVLFKGTDAGTTDDIQLDLQEHNAASGGTSQDLDIITDYFTKSEASLDGDETWARTTQAAASEIGAIAGTAEKQVILVVEVLAEQLSEGFEWVSVNTPDLGSTDVQYGGVLAILFGLRDERQPENLPDWLDA